MGVMQRIFLTCSTDGKLGCSIDKGTDQKQSWKEGHKLGRMSMARHVRAQSPDHIHTRQHPKHLKECTDVKLAEAGHASIHAIC
jgi:hypothetical protein